MNGTDLLLAFLATYAVQGGIALVLAWGAVRLVRSPGRRASLWRGAVALGLVLSLGRVGAGAIWGDVPGPGPELRWRVPAVAPAAAPASSATTIGGTGSGEAAGLPLGMLAASAWILLAGAGIARLGWSRQRELRSLHRIPVDDATRDGVMAGLEADRHIRLSRSERLGVPAALPGEVCLPLHGFDLLPEAQRRALVAHEVAHVERRDPEWRLFGEAVIRLFFFLPLLRVAVSRWNEEAELACDALAVKRTGRPRELAEALSAMAAGLLPCPAHVPGAVDRVESTLVRRVGRILEPRAARRRPFAIPVGIMVSALAALTLAAAPTVLMDSSLFPPKSGTRLVNATIEENLRDGREVRIDGRGMVLDPSSRRLVGIEPGGHLVIRESTAGGSVRRVRVDAAGEGELRWSAADERAALRVGPEIQDWTSAILTEFLDAI